MAAFASLIGRVRPGRKTKPNLRSPQPDFHPYASQDVVYIGDNTLNVPEEPTTSFDSTAKTSTTSASSSSSSTDVLSPKRSTDTARTAGTSLTPRRSRSPRSSRTYSRSPSPESTPSIRRTTPPRMKLSIDLSPDPLGDWFPSHLLDKGVYSGPGSEGAIASTSNVSGISGYSGGTSLPSSSVNGFRGDVGSLLSRDTTGVVVDVQTVDEDASRYEEEEDESDEDGVGGLLNDEDSTEVVVRKLEEMDASTFLRGPNLIQGSQTPHTTPPKKAAPSPIKIPRNNPKVQVIRSSTQSNNDITKLDYHPPSSYVQPAHNQPNPSPNPNPNPNLRIESPYDPYEPYESATTSASASAVSGTTLARALIGNTFVLSSDDRASRYRSGGSVLTRSDSATLPRGERGESGHWSHNSPASASTNGHWSYGIYYTGEGSSAHSPNVFYAQEPMPPNADEVYSPPKNPRRTSVPGLKKKPSTGDMGDGHHNNASKGWDSGLGRSKSANPAAVLGPNSGAGTAGTSNGHRISPISEAPSPRPSPLSAPPVPSVNETDSRDAVPPTPPPPDPNVIRTPSTGLGNGHSSHVPPPPPLPPLPPLPPTPEKSSPKRYSSLTIGSGTSGPSTGHSSSFDLEYYQGLARSPDPGSEAQFNPYTEQQERERNGAETSSSSSGSTTSVNTVGAMNPSSAAAPLTSHFRPAFSPISEESTVASGMTTPASMLSTPPSGGQFGLSRSPGGRKSPARASKMIGNLGPIGEGQPSSSPEIHLLPLPIPPTVFNRQRSGSAPAPIRVIRDPRDPGQYNLIAADSPDFTPHAETPNPRTATSHGSSNTPTTGSGEGEYATYPPNPYGLPESRGQQTFPETPNLFSPMWSAAIPGTGQGKGPRHSMDPLLLNIPASISPLTRVPPPNGARPRGDISPSTGSSSGGFKTSAPKRTPPIEFPQTPLPYSPPTSAFPNPDGRSSLGSDEFMPSLDQQMLLTRAATSVNRSRHERAGSLSQQNGLARARTVAPSSAVTENYPPHPYAAPELIRENEKEEEEEEKEKRSRSSQPSWIEQKFPSSTPISPSSTNRDENGDDVGGGTEAASPSSPHPSETSMSMYSQASPTTYSAQSHRRGDSHEEEPVPPVPPIPTEPKYRSDIEAAASRSLSERKGRELKREYGRASITTVYSNDGDEEDSELSHPLKMQANLRQNEMIGAGTGPSSSTVTLSTSQLHLRQTEASKSSTSIASQKDKALPNLPPPSPPDRSLASAGSTPTSQLTKESNQAETISVQTSNTNETASTVQQSSPPQDFITPRVSTPPRLTMDVPPPPKIAATSPTTAIPPATIVVPPPPPLSSVPNSVPQVPVPTHQPSPLRLPPPPFSSSQNSSNSRSPFPIPTRSDSLATESFDTTPPARRGRYPSIPSLGSPPAYDTLSFDQRDLLTGIFTPGPSTAGSGSGSGSASAFSTDYRFNSGTTAATSAIGSPNHSHGHASSFHTRSNSDTAQNDAERRADLRASTTSTVSRKNRNRPPLPGGPRRPTTPSAGMTSNSGSRQRNGSTSGVSGNSRLRAASVAVPLHSPRFQTPAIKWRGYPMEAAKWTFTSSELQDIVSGAIKHSAEASGIRLLRLRTAQEEIPEELRRMEMQRTDIKTKYKMMARKRTDIMNELSTGLGGDDKSANLQLLEELKDVSMVLDRLAEDLHTTDEQVAQLVSLRDVHNASALAMAIRKLNASFLKQLAMNEHYRHQLEALEGERDDAWKQAEAVAGDYDRLVVDTPTSQQSGSQPHSNRSSRVMAMRKSSLRVSKAGLRTSSSRASISSNRLSVASASGSKSPFTGEEVPPVPPLPRRPTDIYTDIPVTSTTGISTEAHSPNSATRAMMKAHEELCDMLGIKMVDRPRRSRSVGGRGDIEKMTTQSPSRPQSSGGRPTSLPDRSQLTEAYQVMAADRHAMLATLGILVDEP